MPQFFVKSADIRGSEIVLKGDDSHHLLHVRRVKPGDRVMLRCDDGRGFIAEIRDISADGITASLISGITAAEHLPDITLYMAMLKSGNFEFVIQKAVEIGVSRIVPVVTERTVPDPGRMSGKKNERWNRIASEATKQCLRGTPAVVEPPAAFADVIKDNQPGLKIICHPGAELRMKDCLSACAEKKTASLLIGPEGGFSDRELLLASGEGWSAVNLGVNHLRAETAAIVIPSILIYEWSAC